MNLLSIDSGSSKHEESLLTRTELRPRTPGPQPVHATSGLVAVDHNADAIIIGSDVYIFHPQSLERLLIDGDEIKARAPQIAAKFEKGLAAALSPATTTWIEAACSKNSNVGRRVERLNRTAALSAMTAPELRAGLKEAQLPKSAFGTSSTIEVTSADHAVALVDIAADLYYQPRFETTSRKVASFRRL